MTSDKVKELVYQHRSIPFEDWEVREGLNPFLSACSVDPELALSALRSNDLDDELIYDVDEYECNAIESIFENSWFEENPACEELAKYLINNHPELLPNSAFKLVLEMPNTFNDVCEAGYKGCLYDNERSVLAVLIDRTFVDADEEDNFTTFTTQHLKEMLDRAPELANMGDENDETPLHILGICSDEWEPNDAEFTDILLEYNANIYQKNAEGLSAFDMAQDSDNADSLFSKKIIAHHRKNEMDNLYSGLESNPEPEPKRPRRRML